MIRDDGGPGLWGEATRARITAGQPDDGPGWLSLITSSVIVIAGLWLAYGLIVLGTQAIYRVLVLNVHGEPVYLVLAAGLGLLILGGIIYITRDRANWSAVAVSQILASIVGGLISLFGTNFSVGGIVSFFAAAFTAANGFKKLADISEAKTKATKT